ncbi:hypothetical protein D3C80_1794790 [compost metagenome]
MYEILNVSEGKNVAIASLVYMSSPTIETRPIDNLKLNNNEPLGDFLIRVALTPASVIVFAVVDKTL